MIPHHPRRIPSRPAQAGFTLVGLVAWAIVIAVGLLLMLRVVPTVNEYYTAKRAITKAAQSGGATVADIRAAFDRTRQIEYSITSITGKDLVITKQNDKVVVSFAYEKEIELFGPVYLLIKYAATSE